MSLPPAPGPAPLRPSSRLALLFADEHRFWPLCTVLLGSLALLKGLRLPGTWALTQSLVGYAGGFHKRGLLGALYAALHLQHRLPLTLAYAAELLALLAALALFTRRSRLSTRTSTPSLPALFAGSYAVTFLAHILGYTDIPAALLLVALLLVRDLRLRLALSLPAVLLGLLLHENFLLLFLPTLLLSFVVQGVAQPALRRRALLSCLLLAGLALALTAALALQPPLSPGQVDALANLAWDRADFPLREDFFNIYLHSFRDNLHMASELGWHQIRWWVDQLVSLLVLGPPLALILHTARRLIHQHARGRRILLLTTLAAVLSPLVLHLVAIDAVRWNVWVLVDAWLALGLLSLHLPGPPLSRSPALRHAVLLAIALGAASGYGLFDGRQINPYPFFPRALRHLIQRHDRPIPGFEAPPAP